MLLLEGETAQMETSPSSGHGSSLCAPEINSTCLHCLEEMCQAESYGALSDPLGCPFGPATPLQFHPSQRLP